MKNILRTTLQLCCRRAVRPISTSSVLQIKSWRLEQGLSVQKNSEGPLLDKPDYTFLDGRPTPLLMNQRDRMLKNQKIAETIITLNSELEFAIQREKDMKKEAEEKKQDYIRNKLKPKGNKFKNTS